MQRPLLYVSAVVIVLSLVVTVLKLTSQPAGHDRCPKCGAAYQPGDIVKRDNETAYLCRRCQHQFDGPPLRGFSWLQALENWLDP